MFTIQVVVSLPWPTTYWIFHQSLPAAGLYVVGRGTRIVIHLLLDALAPADALMIEVRFAVVSEQASLDPVQFPSDV